MVPTVVRKAHPRKFQRAESGDRESADAVGSHQGASELDAPTGSDSLPESAVCLTQRVEGVPGDPARVRCWAVRWLREGQTDTVEGPTPAEGAGPAWAAHVFPRTDENVPCLTSLPSDSLCSHLAVSKQELGAVIRGFHTAYRAGVSPPP